MLTEDIFKHYEIDAGDIEKLIEMWIFFSPKDDPQPIDSFRINLNKKYSEVTYYQMMFVLVHKLFNVYFKSRFFVSCMDVRTQDHVDYMYEYFIKHHKSPEKKETPLPSTEEEKINKKPTKKKTK